MNPPLDPRSIANTILRFAHEYGFEVTQLSIQKILYFVHGRHLTERGTPLVLGNFEAWKYGPVHPVIYSAFKRFGDRPIAGYARSKDLISGFEKDVAETDDRELILFVRETAAAYLKISPGRLVDLSHAPNSPWEASTKSDDGGRVFGVRMTNEEIRSRFKFHKISVNEFARSGEPNEESPPSRD